MEFVEQGATGVGVDEDDRGDAHAFVAQQPIGQAVEDELGEPD